MHVVEGGRAVVQAGAVAVDELVLRNNNKKNETTKKNETKRGARRAL